MSARNPCGARMLVTLASFVAACAAAPPRAQTSPKRSELVVDEATVVAVPGRAIRADGSLPALPQALATTSPAFQQGFGLAQSALAASGPAAPLDDSQASYDAWIGAELQPWLEARGKAVQAALESLAGIAEASPTEQVIAAALVGLLYARTEQQLLAVPPPPAVRADDKLLHIYQDQVNQTSATWTESAIAALRQCANGAAAQAEPTFGAWLDRCQQELARLQQQAADAKALSATVQSERAAEQPETAPE